MDSIGRNLEIAYNDSIESLSGLENTKIVKGNIFIVNNQSIKNIDGLHNLSNFKGEIAIARNKVLDNINGLYNVSSTISDLSIINNSNINTLSGIENILEVQNNIIISNNASLKNLTGLNGLVTVGNRIEISENTKLTSLVGLNSLSHVEGFLSIYNNHMLKNLIGLSALQSVGNSIYIDKNDSLVSLIGLETVDFIGNNLFVTNHPLLTNLGNLQQLNELGGTIQIVNNNGLHNLSGLDSLHKIGGGLVIANNRALKDLTGLSHIKSISSALDVSFNDSLVNLYGLHNLKKIGNGLSIYYNSLLNNISALENIDSIGGTLSIFDNPSLQNCSIYPVCNHIFNYPELVEISDNGQGCSTPLEVELSCGAVPIFAQVLLDNNGNCQKDSTDILAEGILVRLSGNTQQILRPTQTNGTVQFGYLDNGPFSLTLPQIPTGNWAVCQDTLSVLPDTIPGDTIHATFFLQPLNQCPQLTVDLGLPAFFRGCLVNSFMQVATRNIGTINAEGTRLAVVMPDGLTLTSSVPAIAAQSGDTLFFNLGEIPPFQANIVNMVVKTTCDAVQIGQALCLEAFATWTNPCIINAPPASEIRLFSECMSDTTVRFTIKNVGDAATQNVHNYVIIEDEVILDSEPFSLDPLASLHVDVASNGATYRMEATKYDDGTLTSTAVESCGGFTPGFITAYWLNDGLRNYDFDCREIRAAYDPNQKTAIPTGVGPEHLMAANKPIQYTIDFQNTGTDTAFRVQLLDVLPPQLNINSFRPGFSSHPYTWEIRGADTLEVLFYPIMLPDSNVNEAASHGWFSFEMEQKPDLPDGTTIENTAAIIFDYNPPIITNTVLHTIGKLTVSVDEPQQTEQIWQVLTNPLRYTATFRAKELVAGEKRFELVDAVGRVVRTEHFDGQEFEFRRGLLAGGLYYFRILDAKGRVFSGKIIASE